MGAWAAYANWSTARGPSASSSAGPSTAATLPFDGSSFARPAEIEQSAAGDVVAAVDLAVPSTAGLGVARLTPAGELDAGFGDGGTTVVDFGGGNQSTGALALAGDRILVAGGAGGELAAARLRAVAETTPGPTPTPTSTPIPAPTAGAGTTC